MFSVPQHILDQTIRVLADCGDGRCECVVYWAGPNAQPYLVDGWVHPAHRRSPGSYEVDGNWVTSFFFTLARQKRGVRAQLHTHAGPAFHSYTDDRFPLVSQAGFISIVLPDFARGQQLLESSWVGVLQRDGLWREVPFESAIEVTQ